MRRRVLPLGLAVLFIVFIALSYSNQTEADILETSENQQESLVEYLERRLNLLGVPVKQIAVLQDNPLEIELTIQSLTVTDKYAPDDFVSLQMAFRESVLASDKGYQINGLTTVVVNAEGKQISKGWYKVEPEIYRRLAPPELTEAVTENLLKEKLTEYELLETKGEVVSLGESPALDLRMSNLSKEEVNQIIPSLKDTLDRLTKGMNTQGAGIAMVKLRITSKTGETLLNYLVDLQFGTEGWWTADGVNIDVWRPSIPAPPPSP